MPATLTKSRPTAPPHITRKDIEQYLALLEEKREIERHARSLAKQAGDLAAKLKAFVDAHKKGKIRSVDRSGYRLAIELAPGSVAWAKEFEQACGQDQANQLRATAPPKEKLTVAKI